MVVECYKSNFPMGSEKSLCSSSSSAFETDASNTIQFDGQKFIVPAMMNFDKQATFAKIQSAAKSFCNVNRVNYFYYPLITRMIAYRHQKIFLGAWTKLAEDGREEFLDELSHVQHDLMDSFYHHYFRKQKSKTIKKSLKNTQVVIPKPIEDARNEKVRQVGREMLANGKVAVVFMCAGYSSRFDEQEKFLCPINLYEKVTILDLMFGRLKKNGAKPTMSIVVSCNEMNVNRIQRYIKGKNYYGFDAGNIHFMVSFSLPIFDTTGEYCFDSNIKLIKRSSGTANCAEQIFSSHIYQEIKDKGVEYVCFSGAENLLENPCDPSFLGTMIAQKRKAGARCVKPQFVSEPMLRYYQSNSYLKIIQSNNFDQLANGFLDKLPVALNSLAFELETLRKISKDYTSNISLAQHYQQLSLQKQIFDFNKDKTILTTCYNFQKDIKYLMTCVKDPLLFKIPRSGCFAPIYSRSRDYSFNEAISYYKQTLTKQLADFSSA